MVISASVLIPKHTGFFVGKVKMGLKYLAKLPTINPVRKIKANLRFMATSDSHQER